MYNPDITDQALWRAGKDFNINLVRYDDEHLDEMISRLEGAVLERDKWGVSTKTRQLTPAERDFIKNERLVCKYDFDYFFRRYVHTQIKLEGESVLVDRIKNPLEPQKMFMQHLSNHELALSTGKARDGYMFICCKARQEGYTTIARGITMQRVLFWEDSRALAASLDDTTILELYDRDHTIYDNLPWWLQPMVEYDTKGKQFTFGKMKSSITYATGNQKGGLGTSKTIPVTHITELGLWDDPAYGAGGNPEQVIFNLQPTWPQSPDTFVMLESTSNGRGNFWCQYVTASREHRTRFTAVFCGWYVEPRHNRDTPPDGWQPLDRTKEMIALVERTSPGYCFGKTIRLEPEQAYWWEKNYLEAKSMGRTAYFLTNYPTTLEESFQSSGNRAFSSETIDLLKGGIKGAVPYWFSNTQPIGKIT